MEALIPAIARAQAELPELRAELFGDGPERERVKRIAAESGMNGTISIPGFADTADVDSAFSRALAMVLPSRREGYGLVVVEAASHGTPSIVVADPDNAAVELVEDGVNGFVASSVAPDDIAAAIFRVNDAGPELRRSTAAWFADNARRLSIGHSLEIVTRAYAPR